MLRALFEKRLVTVSVYAAIFSQTIFVAWLIYALLSPSYLSYHNLPFRVLTPVVKAGNPVMIEVSRCNRESDIRIYTTTRELVCANDNVTAFPSTSVALPPGCRTVNSSINIIPPNTPPGICIVQGAVETNDYFFKRYIRWYSEPFEVVP